MAQRDGTAVHIQAVLGKFAEMARTAQGAGEFFRAEAFQNSKHLGGEGFVNFDNIGMVHAPALAIA